MYNFLFIQESLFNLYPFSLFYSHIAELNDRYFHLTSLCATPKQFLKIKFYFFTDHSYEKTQTKSNPKLANKSRDDTIDISVDILSKFNNSLVLFFQCFLSQ